MMRVVSQFWMVRGIIPPHSQALPVGIHPLVAILNSLSCLSADDEILVRWGEAKALDGQKTIFPDKMRRELDNHSLRQCDALLLTDGGPSSVQSLGLLTNLLSKVCTI